MLYTPISVGSLGVWRKAGAVVLKHEADVKIGVLVSDCQMLHPVTSFKVTLCFDDDPIGENEVWGVCAVTGRLDVLDLDLLVSEVDLALL